MVSEEFNQLFDQVVTDYHKLNKIDSTPVVPYSAGTLSYLLYQKCWIDTAQWHMEDEVRNPDIDPVAALSWKRMIDQSNQDRTDIVEQIDDHFYQRYQHIEPKPSARFNTESPAWAIDRLSILALKIYHMREETLRTDTDAQQLLKCQNKLAVLLQQRRDLTLAIDQLLQDIENGDRYMRVYRQMKMYNDPLLNPILYGNKQ
ncbi:DUF4254 domain-containing protein [Mucilaginibacter sp. Bleaf8]|uniref:DUF4254 domain-containing protein n=1 Tax=Mucilaginibacter sp. Bleaf8 TaxID=2834430 RepID=UPI001BCE34FB|nr:DUF4254 domain-containing protein [Mucilaginibacter sp. Bleaf8]MBS7563543.1 DUF4254 domain-containing protein [Mucilaginibacter sp. Bleaf8]